VDSNTGVIGELALDGQARGGAYGSPQKLGRPLELALDQHDAKAQVADHPDACNGAKGF